MNEEEKEAIDILKNSIADYVIGEYCEKCADNKICNDRNEDCYYIQAIDKVLNLIEKQQKEIEDLKFKYQARKDRTKAIIEGLLEEAEENENKYDDFTTAYLQGVYDGKKNLKYKIKELIEEKAMTDTYNFKTISVKDIEELLGD